MRGAFAVALVVWFVGLSLVADRSASGHRTIAGTVVGWEPGESITIRNEQTDPGGVEIRLRSNTSYQGDRIAPGVVAQVWYRSVGERRPVADRVRVIRSVAR
jgi:hypothetical protein